DMIKGKQGRFRENLLGKRVDYSARSVIVVGPSLRLHQCGLPKKIALELYQPFIIRRLKELGHADTIKSAKKMLERKDEEVWDILEEVINNRPVMLNRAPTLHRMGIQAFEPVLVEGNAIKLHPLVCRGFNADFDGDQMAVHLPLSLEAQVEAHTLLMSTNNIFSPANGSPIISPSQDVVMGCYYLTQAMADRRGEGMTFSSLVEVELAYSLGIVDTHTEIKVRLPADKKVKSQRDHVPGELLRTTVGRVMFNDMLPKGMPFYNIPMRGRELASVISDCYAILGRRATIDLLDDMNQLGFRESTRSGLSFATDDLITPPTKAKIIAATEKAVMRIMKHYQKGVIAEGERYNQVLDAWTHAREQITSEMMTVLENDRREPGYCNPIFLMAHSGARGGVEQIRQLAGMRGLMAKPSGKIIETPIKANFREGLNVLEYFSSTHGARKGLADTALKTADSGYLTRKLADVAQNVVITMHDCGTTQGITKGVIYRGEKVEVGLADSIHGRVSRANIVNPITDEVIVRENELITREIAGKIEALGLEKIQVRSPMTCDSPLGNCALCYGMDLSTGSLVEQGMAVGIIAAQSIGEPGTQLTMRTFHIGGIAARAVEESEIRAKKGGVIQFTRLKVVRNDAGEQVVLTRNGEIVILDPRGRELEQYDIPAGSQLMVEENQEVAPGTPLCRWDPHSIPILAEIGGRCRYEDVIEGETMRIERDPSGHVRRLVMEHKGDLHPQVVIEDETGRILDFYYLPEKAHIEVNEGDTIVAGTLLAKTPRDVAGTQDITGGLPRITEIFEARKPKEPAVIAEIDGIVELLGEKRRGKRTIIVRSETGIEREHLVSHGKHLRVHASEYVRAGEALVDGPLVPHDILRISGEEAVQQYLVREIQNVYRSQRVEIDDKHIEIIVSQMLRKVLVESIGDTTLLPGSVMDKFDFRTANDELEKCLKITKKGDSEFEEGAIVPIATLEQVNAQIEALGGETAEGKPPQPATASTQLLGITKASVQSSSFISAASFQETTKVLTEAALAGKVDNLVGLKENVILGHLVPAGTGFHTFQGAEVRINPQALDILAATTESAPRPSFRLLDDLTGGGAVEEAMDTATATEPDATLADELTSPGLDSLFGDDEEDESDPPMD
ncbi:MAG: DNA-directed RNA polymerase subunit beta', partial [Pirellulaceae bacterium]|nr:DNA-directed RNA polymerase subunit beta' [Pirellulaceae bacterium]